MRKDRDMGRMAEREGRKGRRKKRWKGWQRKGGGGRKGERYWEDGKERI